MILDLIIGAVLIMVIGLVGMAIIEHEHKIYKMEEKLLKQYRDR